VRHPVRITCVYAYTDDYNVPYEESEWVAWCVTYSDGSIEHGIVYIPVDVHDKGFEKFKLKAYMDAVRAACKVSGGDLVEGWKVSDNGDMTWRVAW
jgi:hypothetical protein